MFVAESEALKLPLPLSLSTLKGKDAQLIFYLTSKKLDNTVYHHAVSLP